MVVNYESRRILISGAGGNIGKALTRNLLENGHKVICITTNPNNLSKLCSEFRSLSLVHLRDWVDLSTFEVGKVDTFVHLSGQTSSYIARENFLTDIKTNLLSLAGILNSILNNQPHIEQVILASSMTQYGQASSLPIDENHPTSNPTFYEMGKNFNEVLVENLFNEKRIRSFNFLRLSNVYGSHNQAQRNRGFLDLCIQRALAGEPLYYYGTGNYIRDFVYIDDVVDAFEKSIQNSLESYNGAYNIGTGVGISIKSALEKVATNVEAKLGFRPQVRESSFPENSYDIERRNSVANSHLFTGHTGWHPKTSFENGIEEIINRSVK